MSRAQRLLDLTQIYAVIGSYYRAHSAVELGISLRTLYRDIERLQEQGAAF